MVACGCHLCWEKSEQSCSLQREMEDYSCYFVHHLDWGDKEYVDKVDVDQPVFVSLHCQDGIGITEVMMLPVSIDNGRRQQI